MKEKNVYRRLFLKTAGFFGLFSTTRSFGFLGLFGNKSKGLEPDSSGAVKIPLQDEKYQQLRNVGAAIKIKIKGQRNPVIVIRKDENAVIAISSRCTHLGCEVDLPSNGMIDCSCHGSQFKTDGTVVKGPADKKLERFKAEIKDMVLVVYV